MTITSLIDDYCPQRGFRGEHGLSLFIERDSFKLLFDAGQGPAFLGNAVQLGIDLARLDAIVLSHGHYDHGGGLKSLYDRLTGFPPPLFAGHGFDILRRSQSTEGPKDIGLSSPVLPLEAPPAIIVEAMEELSKGALILPCAEQVDGRELDPKFRVSAGGLEAVDGFADELSLVFDEGDGLVIVAGCAHRGIVNIARAAMDVFPGRPVKALVGGFHLANEGTDVLEAVAASIAALSPGAVFCSHCTGPRGFAALSQVLPGRVAWLATGMSISL
jgi:7,8-dihydropterin-6-yl-methyl-4-(beta-D-ribofuranosyl)aminobenzene 5'-phosphate synthase